MKDLYYTVEEAAKILHAHPNTIREWCESGKLEGARKFGRKWLIPKTTIDPQEPPQPPERK
jgi:excisionase family DNA binding protein